MYDVIKLILTTNRITNDFQISKNKYESWYQIEEKICKKNSSTN